MRPSVLTAALLSAAIIGSGPAAAQQDFSTVEFKTIPVADGIYMLMGAGGNIGVSVGEDGILIIDDEFEALSDKLIAALRALSDGPIAYVLNTHWHGDHTGGNAAFAEMGAVIIAQDNVYTRMSTPQTSVMTGRVTAPSPTAALPVITYNDTATLHFNGQTIVNYRVGPAHTDTDSITWWPDANVYHMGDTYFSEMFPFFDLSSGGDVRGMIKVAQETLARIDDDTKIIPGHGRLATKADLQHYTDMVIEVRDRVEAAMARGETLEQMTDAGLIDDLAADWGSAFMQPSFILRIFHMSLSQ